MSLGRRRAGLTRPILAAAACAVAVAAVGVAMTDLSPWYYSLREPAWKPPDVLFGPAWTTIYALSAIAGVLAWRRATAPGRRRLLWLFAANAVLNLGWSALFFRLQRPDWALIEVVPFWLSILVLMIALARSSSLAALLLVPYLAWVAFAGLLNLAVVQLNAPFGGA